jgi:sugar phosphate isomerase/epimerase
MKFLGRTQPLNHLPIDSCLGVIAQLGFDGVEICLENDDIAPDSLTVERAEAVAARVAELGLSPHSVSYHRDYIYDDNELDRTLKAIELTPRFGTDVFVFSGCRRHDDAEQEWDRMIERTRTLADVARKHSVWLAQEFEPGFVVGSTEQLLKMFTDVGSERLAANLDLGHMFLEDPDPLMAIRSVGSRIAHCHIENMAQGVHRHLLPHEGDMDLASYLRTLVEVGFEGGLALDLYGVDYEAVSPPALQFLRSLLPGTLSGS